MRHTEVDAQCLACGSVNAILAPLGAPSPTDTVCAHCACGLALLARREEAEWVKVAVCREPGGHRRFLPISNLDVELIEQLKAAGRDLHHGDVYEADMAQLAREEDHAVSRSRVSRRLREGTPSFRLERTHLEDDRLFHFIERILTPQEPRD